MATAPDVLVIGAGPAGAATALQLAREGFAVTLADKQQWPRHKPCGEFFSPECVPYLEQLGLHDVFTRLHARRVDGMRLSTAGAGTEGRFRRLPGRGAHAQTGFGLRREVFDHELVRAAGAAGATLLPAHELVGLCRGDDGAIAGAVLRDKSGACRTIAARFVVGADGVHSRVARALGVQRRVRWLDQMALVARFRGVPPQARADVHLLCSGFFAATTVDDGLYSVNIVLPRRCLRERDPGGWDAFVARHLADAPHLQARLQQAERVAPWRGTGPFAFRTTAQALPGVALVGDAAGYVDPATGEGIYFALFGARALGTALSRALHSPACAAEALADYERTRRRELAPRLHAAKLLQRGLRHPWLVRRAVATLQRWPRLADLVVTMIGDTVHPRDLLRPSFWRAFAAAQ